VSLPSPSLFSFSFFFERDDAGGAGGGLTEQGRRRETAVTARRMPLFSFSVKDHPPFLLFFFFSRSAVADRGGLCRLRSFSFLLFEIPLSFPSVLLSPLSVG